ncbi:hypothetical protein SmJEL517_g06293 [Synchytrium microbalum]|uniref:Potassium channel tetramerisation-type BTB domain-containing protein n=1 Tax=Synchytrium microbalum TaxID=1806994 RepID=A0A507BQ48_9FUNG|nr:uncharacterized protein SmJEL517_g06293 [Synchytrium microbalum]TPX30022.1 hypothetical protein SmJEL517_g06293 [Synchytrium microbalum]
MASPSTTTPSSNLLELDTPTTDPELADTSRRLTDLLKSTAYLVPSLLRTAAAVDIQPMTNIKTRSLDEALDGEINTPAVAAKKTPLALISQAIIQLFVTFAVLLKQSPIPDAIVSLTESSANAWVSLDKEFDLTKKVVVLGEAFIKIQIFLASVFLTALVRSLVAFQKTRGYQELMQDRAAKNQQQQQPSSSSLSGGSSSTNLPSLIPSPTTQTIPKPTFNDSDIVTLSIGGVQFASTWGTLADGGNVFTKLSRGESVKGILWRDGLFFVDRDGTQFRYILNYLRGIDTLSQLEDPQILKELLVECDFYHMPGMKHAIEMMLGIEPSISPPYNVSPTRSLSSNSLRQRAMAKVKSVMPGPISGLM